MITPKWRDLLMFNQKERNGILLLIGILFLLLFTEWSMPYLVPSKKPDSSKWLAEVSQYKSNQSSVITLPLDTSGKELLPSSPKERSLGVRFAVRKFSGGELKTELNSSDSAALEALPGLGPVLASRIIKYRKMLGGYCRLNQLKEVYGMKEEHFLKAVRMLSLDSTKVTRLSINFAAQGELGRHPYIGYKRARSMIRERDRNGKFSSIDELSPLFPGDSLKRVAPYLKLSGND